MLSGWRIGRVAGISLEIHVSWLIVFSVVVYDLGTREFCPVAKAPWLGWTAAVLTALGYFVSVLVHELSHCFVARRLGLEVTGIVLFAFGGVAQVEDEPKRALDELLISIAGPAVTVLFALVCGMGSRYTHGVPSLKLVSACLELLALANVVIAVFNMLPGFPLDGGRALRSLLWIWWADRLRATRVVTLLGQVLGCFVAIGGLLLGFVVQSLWIAVFHMIIGIIIVFWARFSWKHEKWLDFVSDILVVESATPQNLVFPVDMPLHIAVSRYLDAGAPAPREWIPVLKSAQPVGLLRLERVHRIPRWQWEFTPVEAVMEPLQKDMVVRRDRPAIEALRLLEKHGRTELLVVDYKGNLEGLVSEDELWEQLKFWIGIDVTW